MKGGLLQHLKTPTEALAHPYFAPYIQAAADLNSLARASGAAASPVPPPTAVYDHPMGGGSGVASAPSSLLMGPQQQSLSNGALALGLTSPGRGGAGAAGGVGMTLGLPLQLPLGGMVAAAEANKGFVFGAGADTARGHYTGHHAQPQAAHPLHPSTRGHTPSSNRG